MQVDTRVDYQQFEIFENFTALNKLNHTKCLATSFDLLMQQQKTFKVGISRIWVPKNDGIQSQQNSFRSLCSNVSCECIILRYGSFFWEASDSPSGYSRQRWLNAYKPNQTKPNQTSSCDNYSTYYYVYYKKSLSLRQSLLCNQST